MEESRLGDYILSLTLAIHRSHVVYAIIFPFYILSTIGSQHTLMLW